jgi:plastocyanin
VTAAFRTYVLALLACASCTRFQAEAATVADDAGGDAGCPAGESSVALCTEEELANNTQTNPEDARQVLLPSSSERAPYQPNCMVIRVGQTVTWVGKMTDHPLEPRAGGSPENPIPEITRDIRSVPVTFRCPGDYNFGCGKHGGAMAGTIRVVP